MNDVISRSRSKRSRERSRAARTRGFRLPLTTLCIGLGVWFATVFLIFLGRPVSYLELNVGQTAPRTITASVPFEFKDNDRTEANRKRARDAVEPIYTLDTTSIEVAIDNLNTVFGQVAKAHKAVAKVPKSPPAPTATATTDLTLPSTNTTSTTSATPDGDFPISTGAPPALPTTTAPALAIAAIAALEDELQEQNINCSASNLLANVPAALVDDLRTFLGKELQAAMRNGVMDPVEAEGNTERITLMRSLGSPDESVPLTQLTAPDDLPARIKSAYQSDETRPRAAADVIPLLITPYANRNLIAQPARTRRLRENAAAAVPDEVVRIAANQPLVTAGDPATAETINRLEAHRRALGLQANPILRLLGTACILLAGLFIATGLLLIVLPKSFEKPRRLLLGAILALIPLFIAKGLVILNASFRFMPESILILLIPVALAPLLATLLVNSRFGMVVGLWTSFATAVLADNSFTIFCLGLLLTVVASVSVKNLHRRSGMFVAGLALGLAQAIFVTGATALDVREWQALWPPFVTSLGTGLITALLATVVLPLFEWAFRTTSPVRLIELGDLQHPLLQRLALEAPGTYHHSIMVANLAKAAAVEIGANDLLVRVAALYHDVGKLTKPEFFIENNSGQNPHDDLAPSMSTLLITAHVKEGVTLAESHKLPRILIEGIRTHHGTQVVSFFYHRAREQAAEDGLDPDTISASDFRYPGPLPETPELGILCLADTVEAASRSIDNPTPKNIETLVDRLIADKLADGQLDNCALTFSQLTTIKKAFVFCLTTSLHSRIAYPKDDEYRTHQPSEKHPDQRDADPPVPALANSPGA